MGSVECSNVELKNSSQWRGQSTYHYRWLRGPQYWESHLPLEYLQTRMRLNNSVTTFWSPDTITYNKLEGTSSRGMWSRFIELFLGDPINCVRLLLFLLFACCCCACRSAPRSSHVFVWCVIAHSTYSPDQSGETREIGIGSTMTTMTTDGFADVHKWRVLCRSAVTAAGLFTHSMGKVDPSAAQADISHVATLEPHVSRSPNDGWARRSHDDELWKEKIGAFSVSSWQRDWCILLDCFLIYPMLMLFSGWRQIPRRSLPVSTR